MDTTMAESTLAEHFEAVKSIFFAEWSDSKEWSVKVAEDLERDTLGRCDSKSKTIKTRMIPTNKDELWLLLIHELCHAVADDDFHFGHGPRWLALMRKAADVAHEQGMSNLAAILHTDVEEYTEFHTKTLVQQLALAPGSILDEKLLSVMILDLLIESRTDRSFETIISYQGLQCGHSPTDLVERFPGVRKIYEAAKKEIEEREEDQRRFRELLKGS